MKKKIIIISAVVVGVVIVGIAAFNIAVDMIFARVTNQIVESGIFTEEISGLPDGKGGTVKFDAETVKNIESKVSKNDKVAVLTLLAKALPPEEYSRLMSMLNEGVSEEEIGQAYDIMKKNLTQAQKDQIKGYYLKYVYLIDENNVD